jgi:hypothetical protein
VVVPLGFYFDLDRSHGIGKQRLKSKRIIDQILRRLNVAFTISLDSILDTAITLSIIVQVGIMVWERTNTHTSRESELGGHLYNWIMLDYVNLITFFPVITLMNTPFFMKKIRWVEFRFFMMTLIISYSGYRTISLWGYLGDAPDVADSVQQYKDRYPMWGCVPIFLLEIVTDKTDEWILYFAWIFFFLISWMFTLVLQWQYGGFHNCRKLHRCTEKFIVARFQFKGPPGDSVVGHSRSAVSPNKDEELGNPVGSAVDVSSVKHERKPKRRRSRKTRTRPIVSILWVLYIPIGAINTGMAMLLLWKMYYVRSYIELISTLDVTKPGLVKTTDSVVTLPMWDNDDWTFGQVVAMSLWISPMAQLVYALFTGADRRSRRH